MLKILIIGSCTKKKKYAHRKQPNCEQLKNKSDGIQYMENFTQFTCKAELLYQGTQHKELIKGIKNLRKIAKVDFYILSAGYGLIKSDDKITSYDCSFTEMGEIDIIQRAALLKIPVDFQNIINNNYDFIYLALGKKYLLAIGNWWDIIKNTTIAFQNTDNPNILTLKSNNQIRNAFRKLGYKMHSSLYFKGDFLRILSNEIIDMDLSSKNIKKVLTNTKNLSNFINDILLKEKNRNMLDYL